MADKAIISSQKLTAIADAIRSKNGETDKYTPDQMADKIKSLGNTSKKFVWQNVTDAVKNYIDNVTYDSSDYSASKIADYAPTNPSVSDQYPVGKSLSLHAGTLSRRGYEQNVSAGSTTVYNDIPQKITPYTVYDSAGNILDVGVLKPDYFLRQIKTNGTNNVRDLGGWACDGGTVKYGKLFRGGVVTANDVDLFLNQLGVKYELDLRGKTEASSGSNLKAYVGYSVFDTAAWYTISDAQLWKNIFQVVFTCVKNNLPLYFHCAAGADRTATVACVLEAILGMNQSDIDKDYELTCFYTGTATDFAARRRSRSEWVSLINAISAKKGNTFRDKAVRFCMECGYTIDDINDFRSSMVDGTPEVLTVRKYSVANNLANATNDNTVSAIDELSSYSANIEPSDGYAIDSVQVTMGGADITSSVYSDGVINIHSVTGDIVIIASASKQSLNYTNMIRRSTTTIGGTEIYNGGLGYKNGYRYNSSQVEKEYTGSFITGFIAVSKGDVLRFYGGLLDGNDGALNTWFYDANGNMITGLTPYSLNTSGQTSNRDFVYSKSTLTIVNSKISAIKFTFVGSYSSKTIVTLNESDLLGGVEIDYTNHTCKRIGAANGLNGGTDFDQFAMFGGRKRCNVADDGTINAWYGDSAYKDDGSNGQVMVYQPVFYYSVEPVEYEAQSTGIGYHLRKAKYYVSAKVHPGFKRHPAFYDANGNEIDHIFFSAYEGSIYDTSANTYIKDDAQVCDASADLVCSIAGVKPASGHSQNFKRTTVEQMAQNRGTGWHCDLIKAESANQLLMLIEYAGNLQTAIERGVVDMPGSGLANDSTSSYAVNTGHTAALGNATGHADISTQQINGQIFTYAVNGKRSISYRGYENPWGNLFNYIYGVNLWGDSKMNGGQPYICKDFSFSESKNLDNYECAGFTVTNTNGYISAMGYSASYDWLFMPSECSGNSSSPIGDNIWVAANLNGYVNVLIGGNSNAGVAAGGFCWSLNRSEGAHDRTLGGRLVYVPTAK